MNDPRSSNVRGGAAKQATTDVSDLGYRARRVERPRRGLTWIAEYIFYPRRTRKARREPYVFIHEGHEKHEENILRKMVMSRLPLPNGAMVQK